MLTAIIFPHTLANCVKVKNVGEKIFGLGEYKQRHTSYMKLT